MVEINFWILQQLADHINLTVFYRLLVDARGINPYIRSSEKQINEGPLSNI
jgi:hypothetical protein